MSEMGKHISHEEAREIASRLIAGSFRRDGEHLDAIRQPRFSIPARPGHDDDLRICEYIEQQENSHAALVKALEEAKAKGARLFLIIERLNLCEHGGPTFEEAVEDLRAALQHKETGG